MEGWGLFEKAHNLAGTQHLGSTHTANTADNARNVSRIMLRQTIRQHWVSVRQHMVPSLSAATAASRSRSLKTLRVSRSIYPGWVGVCAVKAPSC